MSASHYQGRSCLLKTLARRCSQALDVMAKPTKLTAFTSVEGADTGRKWCPFTSVEGADTGRKWCPFTSVEGADTGRKWCPFTSVEGADTGRKWCPFTLVEGAETGRKWCPFTSVEGADTGRKWCPFTLVEGADTGRKWCPFTSVEGADTGRKCCPFTSVEGAETGRKWCPVRCLLQYLKATASSECRKGRKKFFISYKPYKSVEIKRATISSWICKVIRLAYESEGCDPRTLWSYMRYRHTRSAPCRPRPVCRGMTVDSVMQSCTWKSRNTFSDFYPWDMCSFIDDIYIMTSSIAGT